MPNPKVGTVTPDVATAVKNAKAGQVQFRVDKAGIIHGTIGRRSFDNEKLRGNLQALLEALNKAKPASSKGVYLRKGRGVVDHGRGCPRRRRQHQRRRRSLIGRKEDSRALRGLRRCRESGGIAVLTLVGCTAAMRCRSSRPLALRRNRRRDPSRSSASADGVPAVVPSVVARGGAGLLNSQVAAMRCDPRACPRVAFEGVDLESQSQRESRRCRGSVRANRQVPDARAG